MRIVVTMMVRDEADIIGSVLENHLAQGVDQFVITDNGSVDGTAEILEEWAARGLIDLRHDPAHRKQQGETVSRMAREAATVHGATWVINADADEFWLPKDRSLTVRDALAATPESLGAFPVDVVDMTGAPAEQGTGLQRLVYRDSRTLEDLIAIGLHAHSTHDAVHVADPDVVVAQGNHYVSTSSNGLPDPGLQLEVLHLPWRSWAQFSGKVEKSGLAYERNPELRPSPNHHGMRDYRRLRGGTLRAFYGVRHPTPDELNAGLASGVFVEDRAIADRFTGSVTDEPWTDDERAAQSAVGRVLVQDHIAQMSLRDQVRRLESRLAETQAELARMRQRKVVVAADRAGSLAARLRRRS